MTKNIETTLRKGFLFIWLLIIFASISACTRVQSIGAADESPIKICWNEWTGDYPAVLAQGLGLFEKYGVDVELIFSDDYASLLPLFSSRQIDSFNAVVGDAILMSPNVDIKVLLVTDSSYGANAIVATSEFSTPESLKGKRIGLKVGLIQSEILVDQMLRTHGMSMNDVILVDMTPEEVPENLGNTIDAGYTWDPMIEPLVKSGNQIVYSDAEAPGLLSDVLVFRADTVRERQEDVQAIVSAWLEAVDWWQKYPEEGTQIISEFVGLSPDEIKSEYIRVLNRDDNLRAFQPGDTIDSIYFVSKLNLDYILTAGLISKVPDLQELLDPSFIK